MKELMKELMFPITRVSKLVHEGSISPVDLILATLERIERFDKRINSYITVMKDVAMQDAKRIEREIKLNNHKGPLQGIPIALKDNIATKDAVTTCGSKIMLDNVPSYDATVVKHLKDAGAIIIGKLNLHEFAYTDSDRQSFFGPTKNPWNI